MSNLLQKGLKKIYGGSDEEIKEKIVNLKLARDFNADGNDIDDFKIINENFINKFSVLLFYDPDCPHCKRFEPTFEQLSEVANKGISFGKINISDVISGNHVLTEFFKIDHVPTIYVKGKNYKLYQGKRDFQELLEYICAESGKCMVKKKAK